MLPTNSPLPRRRGAKPCQEKRMVAADLDECGAGSMPGAEMTNVHPRTPYPGSCAGTLRSVCLAVDSRRVVPLTSAEEGSTRRDRPPPHMSYRERHMRLY